MRLGICGGTFDPFHRGHLEPVLAVRDSMQWDEVVYIPASRQPFKTDTVTASGYHRFAMTVLAIEDVQRVTVSPLELERMTTSFTVDTLETLRSLYETATLDWIIGDDNLPALGAWKNLDRIFELANFVVLTRGGAEIPDVLKNSDGSARVPILTEPHLRGTCGSVVFAHNPTVPVSATEIRARLSAGESIDAFVDPRVSRYIQRHRLYREAHP